MRARWVRARPRQYRLWCKPCEKSKRIADALELTLLEPLAKLPLLPTPLALSWSVELSLPDFVYQLDAAHRDCRSLEPLEPWHWIYPLLHSAVILLYRVVEILARTDADTHWQDVGFLQPINRCRRRYITGFINSQRRAEGESKSTPLFLKHGNVAQSPS